MAMSLTVSPTSESEVTNSFAPIYNPNLLQQQPYGSLVYTSTADTSVYSTLPTSSSSLKTHHYLGPQSINMSSSPDARGNQSKDSRKRGTKKRKKKGSNEPQRPVSAYALFFRDTQAAIKAENSSATFGEISKIVASMWDSLSEEDKHVYKQKTENAKRDYLKHLAAFRANMISKGCFDTEEEDSQPLSVLREKMAEQRATTYSPVPQSNPSIIDLTGPGENELGPPFKLHPAYGASSIGMQMSEPQLKLHPLPSVSSSICLPRSLARPISPVATFTKIIVPGKNGAQSTIHVINADGLTTVSGSSPAPSPLSQHIFIRPKMPGISSQDASAIISSSPLPIQLRTIVTHEPRPPIAFLPSKPGQIIKVVPSGTGGVTFTSINSYTEKGLAVKMVDIVKPVQATSQASQLAKNQSQTTTSATSQGQMPILQLLEQESVDGLSQVSNNTSSNASVPVDIVDENDLMQTPRQNLVPSGQLTAEVDLTAMHVQSHISYPTNLGSCDFDFLIKDDAAHLANTRQCVREGCTNLAVSCPYWDNEYCSNECVYSHCRDVFDAWVSTRQVTTSAV